MSRFCSILLICIVTGFTVCPMAYGQESAAATVSGWGFTVETLDNGVTAFNNRKYIWQDVPGDLHGWQFTRKDGGVRAIIRVTPASDGPIYMAISNRGPAVDLAGWEAVDGWGFSYDAGGETPMLVYRRNATAGEEVTIPQGNWAGGILLAPRLRVGTIEKPHYDPPPYTIVDESPEPYTVYVGSPSIAVLPDGGYVASHDFFGPGTTWRETVVLGSSDRGETWRELTTLDGQWWSTLFVHDGALYILGTSERYGNIVIRRSSDGGQTWTEPKGPESGVLLDDGGYHCAPVPVVVHAGRIWRAFEDNRGPGGWGTHFRAFVISAPVDADLLDAASWTASNRLVVDPADVPFPADRPGWLEGNIVVTPEGGLWNLLRFNDDRGDRAAILPLSDDGTTLSFDPETAFIDFPGGRTKFTIRFDPETKRYWTLANKQTNPDAFRNILLLASSADLRHWQVESTVLEHPDREQHAFQYVDWLFDGADIVAVSRTAWDGSHKAHDANYMTFHRVEDFRSLGS